MIPIKLELQAFGPFNKKQIIDFTLFESDRLFLISGNTGSGKTTIFDAITFSLFGKASGSNRAKESFKSDFADNNTVCYVCFEFISQNKKYIVYREAMQYKPNKKNELSKSNTVSSLTFEDGEILSGTKNVDQEIESILGLDYQQFRKTAMLPQGEFSKFMFDKDVDKQTTLRKIFDTSYIDLFSAKLKKNASLIKQQVKDNTIKLNSIIAFIDYKDNETLKIEIENGNENFSSIIDLLKIFNDKNETDINNLQSEIKELQISINNIDIKYAESINKKFEVVKSTEEEFSKLQRKDISMGKLEVFINKLEFTNKVQSLKTNIEELNTLLNSNIMLIKELKTTLTEQTNLLNDILKDLNLSVKELDKIASIEIEIDELKEIKKQFNELQVLIDEKNQTNLTIQKSKSKLEQLEQKKQKSKLNEEILNKRDILNKYHNLLSEIKKLQEYINKYDICQSNYNDSHNQFINSQAYFLASNLIDNDPCPVCGSTHHPKKRQDVTQEISKQELDKLKNNLDIIKQNVDKQEYTCSILTSQLDIDEDKKSIKSTIEISITKFEEELMSLDNQLSNLHNIPIDIITNIDSQITQNKTILGLNEDNLIAISNKIINIENSIKDKNVTCESIDDKLSLLEDNIKSIVSTNKNTEKKYNIVNVDVQTLKAKIDTLEQQNTLHESQLDTKYIELDELFKKSHITEYDYNFLKIKLQYKDSYIAKLQSYKSQYNEYKSIISRYTSELDGISPFNVDKLKEDKSNYTNLFNEKISICDKKTSTQNTNINAFNNLLDTYTANEKLFKQKTSYEYLSDIANGNRYTNDVSFERYILSIFFEKIVENANIRLASMTYSRYTLNRRKEKEGHNKSSGLSLEVFDFHTGKSRHINTLSGGESFQIALSLSLGLSDIISQTSGGIEINTMFIDEGFGTLDSDSIQTALDTLIEMKSNGRYIGIISHVSELKEKILSKIIVSSSNTGSSIKIQ